MDSDHTKLPGTLLDRMLTSLDPLEEKPPLPRRLSVTVPRRKSALAEELVRETAKVPRRSPDAAPVRDRFNSLTDFLDSCAWQQPAARSRPRHPWPCRPFGIATS